MMQDMATGTQQRHEGAGKIRVALLAADSRVTTPLRRHCRVMGLGRQTTGTGTLIGTVSQPRPNDHARATRTRGARIFSSAPDLRESPALDLALGDVASSVVGHIARQHLDILRMRDGLNELERRCVSEPRRLSGVVRCPVKMNTASFHVSVGLGVHRVQSATRTRLCGFESRRRHRSQGPS